MSATGLLINDIEELTKSIGDILKRIDSLKSFENWLKMQPSVVSVETAGYVIKTEPPRKEVVVTFQMHDGSTANHVIFVALNPDQTFGFASMHKQ